MKGHISLKNFIHQVRDELVQAQDPSKNPFYELQTVQLEVTFALEATGGAKGRLVVVELGGETKASQTHKIILTLNPLPTASLVGATPERDKSARRRADRLPKPSYKR